MSHDHHHHLSKKEKKQAQLKKNRFHQELFNFLRLRRVDEERVQGLEDAQKRKPSEKEADGEWSDKVSTIRNRLNGKQRVSRERWNRFAGTESGGGRGL